MSPLAQPRTHATARHQYRLLGHGSLAILWGSVVGFGFLFWLIEQGLDGGAAGHSMLFPIPGKIDLGVPGTYDAWRMAHMEAIVNGFGLWIVAAVLPLLPFGEVGRRRTATTMVIVAWTIIVASTLDPFFENSRGLRFGLNVTNTIAFFLFYVGVAAIMGLVVVLAYSSFKAAKAPLDEPELEPA